MVVGSPSKRFKGQNKMADLLTCSFYSIKSVNYLNESINWGGAQVGYFDVE